MLTLTYPADLENVLTWLLKSFDLKLCFDRDFDFIHLVRLAFADEAFRMLWDVFCKASRFDCPIEVVFKRV